MKVCIVIPMYNEESIAEHSLETISHYTRQLPPQVTILVVNDCSTDKTEAIVKQLISQQSDKHIQLVSHKQNKGYGGANRTGIQYAIDHNYDYVLFMDSDLTNDPKYLAAFYVKMEEGYDYIKASRYIPGGAMQGVPKWRATISVLGNHIARLLFDLPIHDCTNGFRAGKVDIYKKVKLHEDKFAVIVEELYQVKFIANSFCEVAYILTARTEIEGLSSFVYKPSVFKDYLKYAVKSFLHITPLQLQ